MSNQMTGMQCAAALSDLSNSDSALRHVLDQLDGQLAGTAKLVTVFATAHHRRHLGHMTDSLGAILGAEATLGITCGGVLGGVQELEDGPGLSVWAASMPGVTIRPFRYELQDWPQICQSPNGLADYLETDPEATGSAGIPVAIMLMADPFTTPQQELVSAFQKTAPGGSIVGGMASAAQKPGHNRLVLNGTVRNEGAIGVAISGDVRVDCTVSQGCRPIGKPFVITKADRNVIQKLGGRNALAVVHEVLESLDEDDHNLVAENAIFVGRVINEYKDRFGRGDFLIRNIIGVDEDAGYMGIGDPHMRVGQTIQFQVRDGYSAVEDFELLLEAQKLHGSAAGALLFTCNGRGKRMFTKQQVDANLVQAALGGLPLAGFFAMGEIGPVDDQTFIHGHTASLMVFRDLAGTESLNGTPDC